MSNRLFKKRNTALHIRFSMILVALLALLVSQVYYPLAIRSYLANGASVLLNGFGMIKRYVYSLGESFMSNQQHIHTINQLRVEKMELAARLAELKQFKRENGKLKALMNYEQTNNLRYHLAYVTFISLQTDALWIDQGRQAHVKPGALVFTGKGVIGTVHQSYAHSSEIHLLSHPQSHIPVKDKRSGLLAVAQGEHQGRLKLMNIQPTADIQSGDVFQTSGLGRAYPSGFTVGTVEGIQDQPEQKFLTVNLRLKANSHSLQRVLVIEKDTHENAS